MTCAEALLSRAGHEVILAVNGSEALEISAAGSIDVVLMDVHMPEMDGIEATAAIRERERVTGGHLPIIALTGHELTDSGDQYRRSGFDAHIEKPYRSDEVLAAIARLSA